MGPDGPREAIEAGIARLGCAIRERADGVLCVDCPTHEAKCGLLDLLAWRDARYDPRIRRIATWIAEQSATDAAHHVDRLDLARRLHAHVSERVRFLGEGAETFQSAWQTLNSGVGDCDDSTRALLALARSVALPARLAVLEKNGTPPGGALQPNHATAQLSPDRGKSWFWAECSLGPGVELGEHPVRAARRLKRARAELGAGDLGAMGGDTNARPIIVAAWQAVLGRAPSIFEAQLTGAIARAETGYGTWTGPCEGSHNWGAIMCRSGSTESAACCAHDDTRQDGTPFAALFKVYPDDLAGATDLVRELTTRRPLTRAALGQGSSVRAVSEALYRERYYGSKCPQAIRTYGAAAAKESSWGNAQHQPTSAAGRACDEEAIGAHATRVHQLASEIAAKLGEPAPALGSGTMSTTTKAILIVAGAGAALAVARAKRWI